MNLEDFGKDIKEMHDSVEKILISKNKDYSHSDDVHSNFGAMAQLCKICKVDITTPQGCIQYELLKKIYRMFKLINDGTVPNHESLWDNSMDCHAYQHLLNSYTHDKMYKMSGIGKNLERVIKKMNTTPNPREVPCD